MQTVNELITEARARRDQRAEEYQATVDEQMREEMAKRAGVLDDLFGEDLTSALGMVVEQVERDIFATFTFRDQSYRLYGGYGNCQLIRQDERSEDDDRILPSRMFDAHSRLGTRESNRDRLLLALDELSVEKAEPLQQRELPPEKPRRYMNEFEERMIDALREWMQSAL